MTTNRTLLISFLLICSHWECTAAITNGLVGYWPFDENSGLVAHDASGQGNDGVLVSYTANSGQWVEGKIAGSLHFGGLAARQYVRVPDFPKPTTSLTLSAWVWADSLPQWATIAANWNGAYGNFNYGLFRSTPYLTFYFADYGGSGQINIANGSELSVPEIALGQWHHVAVVVDASRRRVQFWRDGQDAGSFGYSGTFYTAPVPWLDIGGDPAYQNAFQGFWDGKIDDLGLWTRALTSEEIASIYAAGLKGQSMLSLLPKPPTLACSNPQTLECLNGSAIGTVETVLQDSSGAAIEVVWTLDGFPAQTNTLAPAGALISSNLMFRANFGLGEHLVVVSASNGLTPAASCSTIVTVHDTTPPRLVGISATRKMLWPPNHRMVPVNLNVSAVDAGDPSPLARIVQVTSNQAQNPFTPDWEITGPLSLNLRAERLATAGDRVYCVFVEVADASGNKTIGTIFVTVPRSHPTG